MISITTDYQPSLNRLGLDCAGWAALTTETKHDYARSLLPPDLWRTADELVQSIDAFCDVPNSAIPDAPRWATARGQGLRLVQPSGGRMNFREANRVTDRVTDRVASRGTDRVTEPSEAPHDAGCVGTHASGEIADSSVTSRGDLGLLIFATLGFLGFVYLMRPETEEEKRDYAKRFGMPSR